MSTSLTSQPTPVICGLETEYFTFERDGKPAFPRHLPLTDTRKFTASGDALYLDQGKPEVATLECRDPRDIVAHMHAHEPLIRRSSAMVARMNAAEADRMPGFRDEDRTRTISFSRERCAPIQYVTAGSHENYWIRTSVNVREDLIPFLFSRVILDGNGWVTPHGYSGSQRALFLDSFMASKATAHKPFVKETFEATAYGRVRGRVRLQLTCGDSHMCDGAAIICWGSTQLVLGLLDAGWRPDPQLLETFREFTPYDIQRIAWDLPKILDGHYTPLMLKCFDIQDHYYRAVREAYCQKTSLPWVDSTIDLWGQALSTLRTSPLDAARWIDWVAKKRLLDRCCAEFGLDWSNADHREQIIPQYEVAYHDINRETSLFEGLKSAGWVEQLVADEEAVHARFEPVRDTRAFFRGRLVARLEALHRERPNIVQRIHWDRAEAYEEHSGERTAPLFSYLIPDPENSYREKLLDLDKAIERAKKW